jgi:hypothetical protein
MLNASASPSSLPICESPRSEETEPSLTDERSGLVCQSRETRYDSKDLVPLYRGLHFALARRDEDGFLYAYVSYS